MQHVRIAFAALAFCAALETASAQGHSQDRGHKGAHGDRVGQANRRDSSGHSGSVPEMEQRQRAKVQQQRAAEYKRQLDQQLSAIQQQDAQLQQQKRMAQYRVQQEYGAQLRQQRQRLMAPRDYARDPYVSAPNTYRYVVNGANRQTNQYGADVLRQAVTNGYAQGYRAGEADRLDKAPSSPQGSFAYRDASYGYAGSSVDQSDYNYYFRQGHQRGYQDGYEHRLQFGAMAAGVPSIQGTLASMILALKAMP